MPSLMDVWDATRMRLLVELDRGSTLSMAAKTVGISQPSASEHLRLLSTAAGEPVAERNGRSLTLTPGGRILARVASQALSNLSAGESALAARAGLRTGTLDIGASSVPGTYILPHVVSDFVQRCPDVTVRLSVGPSDAVIDWLLDGRITLAITCSEITTPGLRVETVGPDEIVGICSPGILDISSSGHVGRDQLVGQTLLVQERGSSTRVQAIDLHGAGSGWKSVWELGSVDAVKRAARERTGVGFVSIHSIAEERRRGELVEFRVDGVNWGRRDVRAVALHGVVTAPADHYFKVLLTDAIGGPAAAPSVPG
ncbi:LysR substrate-binding domain-containing protein [Mycolicibacterium sp.]|uniref:LysR substrate-binding domain-containing protein n=1 Tax=Mycolicibacterium sp. TaxID=2320850 RepID=UPI003D15232F